MGRRWKNQYPVLAVIMRRIFLAVGLMSASLAVGEVLPVEVKLQRELLAPCCYRETLDHHMSEAAAAMKSEIHAMVARGKSEREIIEHFKGQYGSRILAEPEGATWWVGTLVPLLVLGIGAALVVRFIGSRTRAVNLSEAALIVACLLSLSSCTTRQPVSASEKRYQLHGQIVRLDPSSHLAVIKGDKIEGWMEAMTMEYPVKDDNEYQKLLAGDQIRATVYVRDSGYWIGEIRRQDPKGQ
jgi:cytochrome c-type biogenesis protein CcmH/NrfF